MAKSVIIKRCPYVKISNYVEKKCKIATMAVFWIYVCRIVLNLVSVPRLDVKKYSIGAYSGYGFRPCYMTLLPFIFYLLLPRICLAIAQKFIFSIISLAKKREKKFYNSCKKLLKLKLSSRAPCVNTN